MQVLIGKFVINDIDNIAIYIAKDSEFYALKTKNEIYDKIYGLETSMYHGRRVPELDNNSIQELIYHDNYRIIFQIQNDVVYILQVLNARQSFNKNFRFENLKSVNSN